MIDQLSPAAQKALVRGTNVALEFGHDEIDTGHLLVALLEIPGPVAEHLQARGVDGSDVQRALERRRGRAQRSDHRHVPFSADLKAALNDAVRASEARHGSLAGPGALFQAVTRKRAFEAAELIAELGIDDNEVQSLSDEIRQETD